MFFPLSVPIIKPLNGTCNMHCSYCYMNALLEPHRSLRTMMNFETLRATIDFFCNQEQEAVEFIWHGGEPLLAGRGFFRRAVEYQKPWQDKGKKIANFIQTNGTTVTDEWGLFFTQNGFTVGVSLDAPPETHDALRQTLRGLSTHDKVLKGVSILKAHGVFNGVSCCIGKRNVAQPESILAYFLEHDIKSIKFLRIKNSDRNVPWASESISANEYVDFLIAVFDAWVRIDDTDLEIRDIKSIVDILLGGSFRECTYLGRCDQFVTVYSDGSIYACDSFLNHGALCFGTVFETHQDVLKRDSVKTFQSRLKNNKCRCDRCEWFYVCNGGCMHDIVILNQTTREMACDANRKLFSTIKNRLTDYGLL